jgi:hypothetical protein
MKVQSIAFYLAYLLIAGCVADRRAATDHDPWYTGFVEPTPWECEVHRPCILPVPLANVDAAISMLQTDVQVTMQQVQSLLGVDTLDPDSLLEQAAQDADAQGEKREKESVMPAFAAETAVKMKQWALEHRQTAAKARSLKGKLQPYLVRGLCLIEGTGRFTAYFHDSILWVSHGCLGRQAVPMRRRPVIIFLEDRPTKVYVDVHMVE